VKSKTEKLLDELLTLHPKYIDLSLERLSQLLFKLGSPHLNLPKTIHIAGTNGKGSTQSFIRHILIANGYTCDAYISPHLSKFNERIILNNREVSTNKLLNTLEFVKRINNNNPITFFEITTAAAFVLFEKSGSDFLILETGLGGRLDATNIIPKKMFSIITSISLDHQEFLGNTINKIVREKIGIIKNNQFTIISKQTNEVNKILNKKISKSKNNYFYGKNYRIKKINKNNFLFKFNKKNKLVTKPSLNGEFQIENSSTAIAFAEIIKNNGFRLNDKLINKAIKNTSWPGRLEILNFRNNTIILDGSHNIDGAKQLNRFLETQKIKPVLIFGMLNNKKIDLFLKNIKKNITKLLAVNIPDEKNAFKVNEIQKSCNSLLIDCKKIENIPDVLKHIKNEEKHVFLITGSLYLVGKIRRFLI
tara:strand:- start:1601 stop:2860 length:1260 start_codon:yes stop_codon:yes gene_type:complete